jgi:autotransporter translocation and assembly factor TamB
VKRGRFSRWVFRLGVLAGVLGVLLFGAWLFRFPLFGGLIRETITDALAEEGIVVEVGDLSGSLLFDFSINNLTVTDSPGLPALQRARVGRIHAAYSPYGLLRGKRGWIEELVIEDLSVAVDLAAPPPPASEAAETEPIEIDLIPARVRIVRLDLDARRGEERLLIEGGRLTADTDPKRQAAGGFGADRVFLAVRGREYGATEADGAFSLEDGRLLVEHVSADGRTHRSPLDVKLADLEQSKIEARLDFPLFGGRVFANLTADFGAEFPAGTATIRIEEVWLNSILAFLPDLPLHAHAFSAKIEVEAAGLSELSPKSIEATFEIDIDNPRYEDHRVDVLQMSGTLSAGRLIATGGTGTPPTAFKVDGDLSEGGPISGEVHVESYDLRDLGLTVGDLPIKGLAEVTATVSGTLEQPEFKVRGRIADPRVGKFRATRIDFSAAGNPDRVRVSRLKIEDGRDHVTASGTILPRTDPIEFDGQIDAEIGDLGFLRLHLPTELPTDLAGRLRLSLTADGTIEAPGAELHLTVEGPRAAGFEADRIGIKARVPDLTHILVDSLTLQSLGDLPNIFVEDAEILRSGDEVEVRAPTLAFSRLDWGLRATGSATLHANGDLSTRLSIAALSVGPIARHFGLDLDVEGTLSGSIEAGGTLSSPSAEVDLALSSVRADLEDLPPLTAAGGVIRGRLRDQVVTLEKLRLVGGAWSIEADGSAPFSASAAQEILTAPISGNVRIVDLPLDVAGPLPAIGALDGTLSAKLTLTGRANDPRASGNLQLNASRLTLEDLPAFPASKVDLELTARDLGLGSGEIGLTRLMLDVAGAHITASGSVRHDGGALTEPRLALEIAGLEVGSLIREFSPGTPIEGRVGFKMSLLPGPEVAVDLTVAELAFRETAGMEFILAGRWRDGTFTIGESRLTNHLRTVNLSGTVPFDLSLAPLAVGPSPTREMALTANITGLNLDNAELKEQGIRAAGTADAELHLDGPLHAPVPSGKLHLSGVRFRMEGAPGIDGMAGTIDFDRDSIRIDHLTGKLGRGDFELNGGVELVDLTPVAANLTLTAKDAQLIREEGLRLRTDLLLDLTGTETAGLTLGGKVTVRNLKVGATGLLATQDLQTVLSALRASPSLATLPVTTSPILKDVKLDVEVVIPPDTVHVRNNLVKTTAEGSLMVRGTLAIPKPDGRIYIPEGTVYLVAGTLNLDRGVVTFFEREPLRPYISCRASSRISGTDVFVDIDGPANNPRVLLSSVPHLPVPDIVSLITTGVTRENINSAALQGMASTYLLRQFSSNLSDDDEESALGEILSRVELEFDDTRTSSGGIPGVTATAEIYNWLFVRGRQESAFDYGFDLIFRLTFP